MSRTSATRRDAGKRDYRTPRLEALGPVHLVTQGSGVQGADGVLGMTMNGAPGTMGGTMGMNM